MKGLKKFGNCKLKQTGSKLKQTGSPFNSEVMLFCNIIIAVSLAAHLSTTQISSSRAVVSDCSHVLGFKSYLWQNRPFKPTDQVPGHHFIFIVFSFI